VLRLDVRDERRPGSVALDRRELHIIDFRSRTEVSLTTGNGLKSGSETKKT
jgi:hypothetical protein